LAAFAAVVAAVFAGAMAVGSAVGPIDVGGEVAHGTHSNVAGATVDHPRGLAVAEAGYRLVVDSENIDAGSPSMFAFRIVHDNGVAETEFQPLHERPLHLIVLSRNLVDYLHLHPAIDDAGRWSVSLPALAAGSYRVFADFQPRGADNLTLGTDVVVAGNVQSVPIPTPSPVSTVDGYQVMLSGAPAVGDSDLGFTVERAGEIVHTDPYLGAAGHLIAVRVGDLAYLHVHPHDESTNPPITFTGEFPSAGTYRLFFDFSHGGTVHTATFTVVVPTASADAASPTAPMAQGH
jgi:hypothetical protein